MAAASCTRRAAAVAAAGLVLAGCGGSGGHDTGKRVFDSSCRGCHTLTGHDTQVDGGDLALGRLTAAQVESFARVMPMRRRLSPAELRAVSVYIVERARQIGATSG